MQKILIVGKHPERFAPPPFLKKKNWAYKWHKKKREREPVSKRNHKQKATMSKPKSTTAVKMIEKKWEMEKN